MEITENKILAAERLYNKYFNNPYIAGRIWWEYVEYLDKNEPFTYKFDYQLCKSLKLI